jgi:hypothetical protein
LAYVSCIGVLYSLVLDDSFLPLYACLSDVFLALTGYKIKIKNIYTIKLRLISSLGVVGEELGLVHYFAVEVLHHYSLESETHCLVPLGRFVLRLPYK